MSQVKWAELGLFLILMFQRTEAQRAPVFLYHKFGDDVILPCASVLTAYPDCSSTTWNYNRDTSRTTEVVAHGRLKRNLAPTRAGRLTLGPDCSLTLHDARAEDAGLYICQQWTSAGQKHGDDDVIHLSLLTVTLESKPKPNVQLNLKCSLYTYGGSCKGSTLTWRNDKGKEIQTTTRQVRCVNVLTVESDNSRVTCQLAVEERVKVSVDFTRVFSGTKSSSTETLSDKEVVPGGQTNILIAVAAGTLGLAALLLLLIASLLVRRRRRARGTQTPPDDDVGLKPVGDADPKVSPGPLTGQGQFDPDDGLTYALINHSGVKKTAGKGQARDNDGDLDGGGVGDSVTYATVKTTPACA